jgi:adenosine deaminase
MNSFLSRRDWLSQIPKVELHLHLEGAIPVPALWELIKKYGGDSSVPTMNDLARRFEFSDFDHFIQTWVWKNTFLREYEDFKFIAESVAKDLQSQNIVYTEAFISPPDFARHGLEVGRIIEAIREGLNQVSGIQVNLIVDLVRDYGEQRALETLDHVIEAKALGVLGVGIGGSEKQFPPSLFKSVYESARRHGLQTSAHAGEAAGAESIWDAIRSLKVDRIGHGTRALEDDNLVRFLIQEKIPVEMCPISNLRTKVTSSIKAHPIRQFFDRGMLVSVNTDDPKMFNNTLVDEFDLLMTEHQFTQEEVRRLIMNAIQSSWLSPSEKEGLRIEVESNSLWKLKTV